MAAHPYIFGARDSVSSPAYPPEWQRNPDWTNGQPLPTPNPNEFIALFLVFEGKPNIAAINVNVGGGTIDWGDGATDAPTGSNQFHTYDYASLAGPVYADPWGYGNYKQVIVEVSGGTITSVSLQGATVTQGWADIVADLPDCTSFRFGIVTSTFGMRFIHLEQVIVNDLAAGCSISELLRQMPNVGSWQMPWAKIGTANNILNLKGGRNLILGDVIFNSTNNNAMQDSGIASMDSLTIVSSGGTGLLRGSSIRSIPLITLPASQTSLQDFLLETYSLSSPVTFDAAGVTNIVSVVRNSALPQLIILDASNISNTASSFNSSNLCDGVILHGITVGFSVAGTNLTTTGASASFTALGTAAGTQNITVTGTPFGVALAALDAAAVAAAAIATGKGFTIVN